MPYTETFYPEFQDIRVWHGHGWNASKVLQDLGAFINDPANATFRYITSHIEYISNPNVGGAETEPDKNTWIEVAVLYTE